MMCEVECCLYNRNDKCICETTEINSLGMCDRCILVNLDKDFLDAEKERQLQEMEESWQKDEDMAKKVRGV